PSSFKNSRHGPASSRVSSIIGVRPISGRSPLAGGGGEVAPSRGKTTVIAVQTPLWSGSRSRDVARPGGQQADRQTSEAEPKGGRGIGDQRFRVGAQTKGASERA